MIAMAARESFAGAYGPVLSRNPARRARPRDRRRQGGDPASPATIAPRPSRSAIRRDIEKLAEILVNAERPAILFGQQVWAAAATTRPSRCCAASTFPAISTAPDAACCHPATRIISTARARSPSAKPMSSSSSARRSTSAWAMASASTCRRWCRSIMDYRTVGKNRDITLGLAGDPGADSRRGARRRLRPDEQRQAPGAHSMDEAC